MTIEWKDICNGNYSVSNTGVVKSNERTIITKTGIRKYKERVLIPEVTNDGHLRVVLCEAGKKQRVFVHRLVAEAFIPNPNELPIINHKDENPQNNNVDNLEWCTIAYNNAYNGRHQRIGDVGGVDINVYDKNGTFIEGLPSVASFSNKYSVSNTTAWRRLKDGKEINGYFIRTKEVA